MLLFGLGRGVFAFPFLLLSQYFNKADDSRALNIWMGLGMLGQILASFIGDFMTIRLGWNWLISLEFVTLLYLLTGLLVYRYIDQISLSNQQN